MQMGEFPYDSALIAAVVSVGISVIMYIIAEKKIEPRKWRKNIELSMLEKQLEIYGTVTTLLQAMKQKAKREGISRESTVQHHLMELPDDIYKLEEVFEKERYLLSQQLIDTYLTLVNKDTSFMIHNSKHRKESNPDFMFANLDEMQQIAESEY